MWNELCQCVLITFIIIFLDFSNLLTPRQYCMENYGGGGGDNEASTSGITQDENPDLDLTLRLWDTCYYNSKMLLKLIIV